MIGCEFESVSAKIVVNMENIESISSFGVKFKSGTLLSFGENTLRTVKEIYGEYIWTKFEKQ